MKLSNSKRKRRRRKKCPFCCEPIYHNAKVKDYQWACSKPECQKQRHTKNHKDWEAKNPGYYCNRYENTKTWFADHPGYLKEWRLKKRDIQD